MIEAPDPDRSALVCRRIIESALPLALALTYGGFAAAYGPLPSEISPPHLTPDPLSALVSSEATTDAEPDPLVRAWAAASESLAAATENESASLHRIARVEALLDSVRAALIPELENGMYVRSISDTTGIQWLLSEVESGLARCALARNDLEGLWQHLEKSRDPGAIPISLKEMQSVLYGSEAGLLLYDGGSRSAPIALWVSANHAQATVLPERTAMMQAANAAGERFAADSAFVSRFIPTRPAGDAVRRLYVAPPLGLESFPFDPLEYPVSYIPTGSMLRVRSTPRLWSGNELVVFTGGKIPRPFSFPELAGLTPPRAHESARSAVRNNSVIHELGAAAELLRVPADEPIVLHLDLIARHDPRKPDQSALVCGDLEMVHAYEIARLEITTDLVAIGAASNREMPFALGRGNLVDAFLRAGARSVVVPRWEVAPEKAERFYAEFYAQLRRALPRDQAFRNAQIALLHAGMAPRDVYALAHWGAGNVPVYVMSRKESLAPLLIGWLVFLPPVVLAVAYLRRRYLRRHDPNGRQT